MDTVALLRLCLESLAVSIALLGGALSLQGALKALQKQVLASRVLLLSLYIVSLPMAYYLAIDLEVGIHGLWTGFALGQIAIIFFYAFLMMHMDWEDVFKLNRDRKSEE